VMDSQGFSQGLDDNETLDLVFSTQIGGVNQTDQGFFYSGAAGATRDKYSATAASDVFQQGFLYFKNNDKGKYSASDG
jgi:hypothetical protein